MAFVVVPLVTDTPVNVDDAEFTMRPCPTFGVIDTLSVDVAHFSSDVPPPPPVASVPHLKKPPESVSMVSQLVSDETVRPLLPTKRPLARVLVPLLSPMMVEVAVRPTYRVLRAEMPVVEALLNDCRAVQMFAFAILRSTVPAAVSLPDPPTVTLPDEVNVAR